MPSPEPARRLSAGTVASYAATWALFSDWCAAADRVPLPADPVDVLEFLAECPSAPATQRRRVIAIDHHHTATGHPAPGVDPRVREAVGRPPLELPPIDPDVLTRVEAALRMLPSRGWTGGLFGRRDRCLLVLSQLARIPHQRVAGLTAGDVTVAGGVASITTNGGVRVVEAAADPVLCGPCAVVRWLTTHQVIVTKIATRAVADHLDAAESVTVCSTHVCVEPIPVAGRGADSSLLASPNQWGQTPFPLHPLSRLAVSRQARDLLDGIITVHRELPVNPVGPAVAETVPPVAAPVTGYGLEQHRAALGRRRADIAELAGVAAELDDVDRRAVELNRRVTELLDLALLP